MTFQHTATTTALKLTNTQYVYRSGTPDGSLIVALNVDDAVLSVPLPDLGVPSGTVIAGSGAPPQADVVTIEVAPHGWLIIEPH